MGSLTSGGAHQTEVAAREAVIWYGYELLELGNGGREKW
jgi:hypothetical protein